jgi:hypothetical protein
MMRAGLVPTRPGDISVISSWFSNGHMSISPMFVLISTVDNTRLKFPRGFPSSPEQISFPEYFTGRWCCKPGVRFLQASLYTSVSWGISPSGAIRQLLHSLLIHMAIEFTAITYDCDFIFFFLLYTHAQQLYRYCYSRRHNNYLPRSFTSLAKRRFTFANIVSSTAFALPPARSQPY